MVRPPPLEATTRFAERRVRGESGCQPASQLSVLPLVRVVACAQDISNVYQKERKEFGRPVVNFALSEVNVLDEFIPDKTANQHIERNPTVLDIQAIASLSETVVSPCCHSTYPLLSAYCARCSCGRLT